MLKAKEINARSFSEELKNNSILFLVMAEKCKSFITSSNAYFDIDFIHRQEEC